MAGQREQASPVIVTDPSDASEKAKIINGRVQVDVITGGGGGGTQYTEGASNSSLVGTVALAEGPGDVVRPFLVDASQLLQVDIAADSVGLGGGTQYADGDAAATPTGTVAMGFDGSNVWSLQASALGDADSNPRGLRVGAHLMGWNGLAWYRAGGSAANGIEVDVTRLNDGGNTISIDDGSSTISIDDGGGAITVDGSVTADTELPAAVAHGDGLTLANAPNIIAAAYARTEGATTHSRVSGELSSVDSEAGNDGDFAIHTSDVVKNYQVDLTALNSVYDNTTSQTETSAAIDVRRFRNGEVAFSLVKSAGTPTSIVFSLMYASTAGAQYSTYTYNAWCNMIYDDTICSTQINRSLPFPVRGNYLKVRATATGTSGTASFTVSNAEVILKT